jgi:hypothetical protein
MEAIRDSLVKAFRSVPKPRGEEITGSIDGGIEHADIGQAFDGLSWNDVAATWRNLPTAAIAFMTPRALHFYLPAFMLIVLDEGGRSTFLADSIGAVFSRRRSSHRQKELLKLMDHAQLAAMVQYLDFVLAQPEHGPAFWDDAVGVIREALVARPATKVQRAAERRGRNRARQKWKERP